MAPQQAEKASETQASTDEAQSSSFNSNSNSNSQEHTPCPLTDKKKPKTVTYPGQSCFAVDLTPSRPTESKTSKVSRSGPRNLMNYQIGFELYYHNHRFCASVGRCEYPGDPWGVCKAFHPGQLSTETQKGLTRYRVELAKQGKTEAGEF